FNLSSVQKYIPRSKQLSFPTRRSSDLDITNPFFPKIIRGIEDAALEKGYRIIIGNTDHDAEKEKKYVEMFHQNNCLGIISATWRSEEHTSALQSRFDVVCRLLLENKNI